MATLASMSFNLDKTGNYRTELEPLPQVAVISMPPEGDTETSESVTYESSREVDGDIFLYYQGLVRNMQAKDENDKESLIRPNIDYTYATRYSDDPTKYDRDKMWEIYTGKKLLVSRLAFPGHAMRAFDEYSVTDPEQTYSTTNNDHPRMVGNRGETPTEDSPLSLSGPPLTRPLPDGDYQNEPAFNDDAATAHDNEVDHPEHNENKVSVPSGDLPTAEIEDETLQKEEHKPTPKSKVSKPVTFDLPDGYGFPTTPKGNSLPPLSNRGRNSLQNNPRERESRPRDRYKNPDYSSSFPLFPYERKSNKVTIHNQKHDYSHIKSKLDTHLKVKKNDKDDEKPNVDPFFIKRYPLKDIGHPRRREDFENFRPERARKKHRTPPYGRSTSLDPGLIRHGNFQIPKYAKLQYHVNRDRSPYWNSMYYPVGASRRRRRNRSSPPRLLSTHEKSPEVNRTRRPIPNHANLVPLHWP